MPVRFFSPANPIPVTRQKQAANQLISSCRTDFLDEHPGGAKILKRMAGKDATKQFWKYHGKSVLEKYGGKLKVGTLKEEAKL